MSLPAQLSCPVTRLPAHSCCVGVVWCLWSSSRVSISKAASVHPGNLPPPWLAGVSAQSLSLSGSMVLLLLIHWFVPQQWAWGEEPLADTGWHRAELGVQP